MHGLSTPPMPLPAKDTPPSTNCSFSARESEAIKASVRECHESVWSSQGVAEGKGEALARRDPPRRPAAKGRSMASEPSDETKKKRGRVN